MNNLLNKITWNFIKEGSGPNLRAYIRSLTEILNSLSEKNISNSDSIKLRDARNHLQEVRRGVTRLEEKVQLLEEQVKVLEEEKKVLEELKNKGNL